MFPQRFFSRRGIGHFGPAAAVSIAALMQLGCSACPALLPYSPSRRSPPPLPGLAARPFCAHETFPAPPAGSAEFYKRAAHRGRAPRASGSPQRELPVRHTNDARGFQARFGLPFRLFGSCPRSIGSVGRFIRSHQSPALAATALIFIFHAAPSPPPCRCFTAFVSWAALRAGGRRIGLSRKVVPASPRRQVEVRIGGVHHRMISLPVILGALEVAKPRERRGFLSRRSRWAL